MREIKIRLNRILIRIATMNALIDCVDHLINPRLIRRNHSDFDRFKPK
jgi:hypothetical protein